MIPDAYRRTLTFALLTISLVASIAYDTLLMQSFEQVQQGLAGLMAVCFAVILLIQRYRTTTLSQALILAWPLHLYSMAFLGVCIGFHGGSRLSQVIAYTYFAYLTYLMIPLILRHDCQLFAAFVKAVTVLSALMAIPSFFGALGFESLGGVPMRVKPSYAEFSGIIATSGFFEHPEGHAFQMAIGLLCAFYLLQQTGKVTYLICLLLTFGGLIVSQGRAAIYGICVAVAFHVLPDVFRRSRPVFLGTLFMLLAFPLLIWPYLGSLPGLSGYMRIERGLSGREEAWEFALYAIRQSPATGYGFMASTVLTANESKTLRKSGFSGAGTTFHNTYISKAVDLGVFAALLYVLLYVVPLSRICAPPKRPLEEALVRNMLLLIVTTSIYRDYNIGGVRSTVILGSIFLGFACLKDLTESSEVNDVAALPDARVPVDEQIAWQMSETSP